MKCLEHQTHKRCHQMTLSMYLCSLPTPDRILCIPLWLPFSMLLYSSVISLTQKQLHSHGHHSSIEKQPACAADNTAASTQCYCSTSNV